MELLHRQPMLDVIDTLSSRYLQGKIKALRTAMISLLSEGHLLIEDIPGLGKTSLALGLAAALGLDFGRIQCTSDLLPSDITGVSIFNREENRFHFVKGPIFNHLLLVDEINRTLPKTQSALLEAMEEHRVTLEGVTYRLPEPFMVIATQNPLDHIGTFPLPESQLDRFLLTTDIGYPPPALEKQIIRQGSVREDLARITPLLTLEQIIEARQFVREEITLHEMIADYIHELLERSRDHGCFVNGISTRGGISLAAAARAQAYLQGRTFVVPEDVQVVALAVTSHRLELRPEQDHLNKKEVLRSLLKDIPVPVV
ncbi:MAG: AAA family ATPase [Pelovirga sp.]